jgi:hypothetical protein
MLKILKLVKAKKVANWQMEEHRHDLFVQIVGQL